jgi:hypothetical protein
LSHGFGGGIPPPWGVKKTNSFYNDEKINYNKIIYFFIIYIRKCD